MSDQSVLPKNASLLETGLEKAFRELIYEPGNPFPSLLRPSETPDRMLPYVSRDRGVGSWYDEVVGYQDNRRLASDIWALRSAVGTRAAIKRAVNLLGMSTEIVKRDAYKFGVIVRAIEPPGHANLVGDIVERVELTKSERSVFDVTIAMDSEIGQAASFFAGEIASSVGGISGRSHLHADVCRAVASSVGSVGSNFGSVAGRSFLEFSAYRALLGPSNMFHIEGVLS